MAGEGESAVGEQEFEAVRGAVQKGWPLGSAAWVQKTAVKLELEATLRGWGRPKAAG